VVNLLLGRLAQPHRLPAILQGTPPGPGGSFEEKAA